MQDLKKLCCTEAERAQQLRIDELSRQEKESQSAVNQLTVQIQEFQDKVNSLNDSMEFNDPESASSSGLSHVPSHPLSGTLSRDSCLQPDTQNSFCLSGNVFENLPAPSEPPSAPCEPVRRLAERANELERKTCRIWQFQARGLQGRYQFGILPLMQMELSAIHPPLVFF